MFRRSTGRVSVRSRLVAVLGAALLLNSMFVVLAPVAVGAGPLTITNVDSPDPVQSGNQILYTIEIKNTGGAKVSNVHLTDQINGVVGFGNPPLLDVVSSRGSCSQTNTQVTCDAGSIEGTGTWTVTVRGIVTAAGGVTINNIATVVATKSAQTYTTSAAATTQVQSSGPGGPSPDLTIGKNGPLQVTPGTGITYTITVNNIGTANALEIKVTDTVPAAIGALSVSATSLFDCSIAGQKVTCLHGRVNAGANGTITINGTVASAAAGDLENTSVVDPDNTIDEGILGNTADAAELNNFSNTVVTHVTPVPPPPTNVIFFDKQGPATAVPNEVIQYTLTMTNGNVGRADYITMTDGTQGLQAASLHVVSATSESGTKPVCTVAAPTVTCTMTRLNVNDKFIVVIEGMVVAPAGSTIVNSGAVNANVKNKGYTERDEVQTIINAGRDLTISKSDAPDPVCARSWPDGVNTNDCRGGLHYTFKVGNSGVQDANSVLVRDPLPPGTTYDDAASSPLCDEVPTRIIECVIPTVGAGSFVTVEIVLVAPAALGTITNTVTVDPSNSIFESDETNNIAVETTTVATGIDLTIKKDDETNDPGDAPPDFNVVDSLPGFDPIATSGTQTYRIEVDNTGTQNATGIQVRDILPAGTIFLTAEEVDLNGAAFPGLHGFTCSHDNSPTGGIVDCIGGSLLGSADEFYFPPAPGDDKAFIQIKVFARPTVGLMHNEVRVDPLNQIAEYDETDNIEFEDTTVVNGDSGIGAFNELSITKSSDPDTTVSTSTPVTWTITVTNNGTDPAVNVLVRDTLPVGFSLISAFDTAPGALAFLCVPAAGNVVDCNGATIPGGGGSRQIAITAFSSAVPGSYTNQAIVDPTNAIPEGNETNNAASDGITVSVGAGYIDLQVNKCDSPPAPCVVDSSTVTPGGLVTYRIRVENFGTNPAFGVRVRDVTPAGTTFVSASDVTTGNPPGAFSCVSNAGAIDCFGATIDGTGFAPTFDPIPSVPTFRDIEVVLKAPLEDNRTLINQAFVDPDNAIPESNETNNSDVESTTVESGTNLVIEKTGPTTATQSQTATYDITITNGDSGNASTEPAIGVVMVDPLPVGMIPLTAYTDNPAQNNFSCQVQQNPVNKVTCVGDLDSAEDDLTTLTDSVVIHVEVFITATDDTKLDNEACVDPANVIVEDNELDNCSTASTVVGIPDLAVSKSASVNTVSNGQTFDYSIVVSNQGDSQTPGAVTVTDTLPVSATNVAQVTFVSYAATNDFSCTHASGVVTCTDSAGATPGLQPGESATITITVTVTTSSGPIVNNVTVTNVAGEVELDNNHDDVSTSVGTVGIDLVLTNLGDQPDPVAEGDTVTYKYIVTNAGTAPTATFDITQVFTDLTGTTPISAVASQGFQCTGPSPLTVTCTGDLPAGQSTTVTVVLQTSSLSPATIESTITADAGTAITETNEANNTATETTTVTDAICTGCVDLTITDVIESADPIDDGDSVAYTIGVGNVGDLSTNTTADPDVDVQILIIGDIDALSDPGSFSTTTGFDCNITAEVLGVGVLVDCVGELLPGQGTILTVTVTAASANQNIDYSAQAFLLGTEIDNDPSNNGPSDESTTVNP